MSSHMPNDQRPLPHAGRPRGDAWRSLVAEGIEWEGQVLLGPEEQPLSARLIITSQRLAFAKGGEVVLDIARWWLKRPPFLSGNGAINLRIETGSGHRDRLTFSARDGRPTASEIVTLLTHGKQALDSVQLEPVYTDVPRRTTPRPTSEPYVDARAEPDQSSKHVPSPDHVYSADVIDATTLQILDTTDFPPVTETQTPSTHRGSTTGAGAMAGDAITISTLGNQTHRDGEWSLSPIPSLTPHSSKSSKAGWAFRLSGLVVLIALAAALGTSGLPDTSRLADRGNSIIAPLTSGDTATAENLAQVLPTSTEPAVIDQTQIAELTAISLGVGGETITVATFTATIEQTATVDPTDTPPPTATNSATVEPTIAATDAVETEPTLGVASEETATEIPVVADTATEVPTELPTETVMPTETVAPTEIPVTEVPTLEPTLAPTDTATPPPTVEPSPTTIESPTVEATLAVTDTATVEPSPTVTVELTPTVTETPAATPTPGFPFQERTIKEDEVPDQVFSTSAFRYTVELAERGAEIPTLELPAVDAGEWVVIVLHADNWSTEPATLNMADFQLLVSGDFGYQFVGMDASSPDIGRFLGFDPVLEIAELRSIPAGEGMRLALVYLVPPTTTGIELIDDTSGLNIGPALEAGGDVTNLGTAPERPDLVEATVNEVVDGRTIVVESDGFTATIQYLGIVVPTGDQCFAAEATLTNSNIVLGQTVYLEREFRNRVSADGETLARDVWIDNKQGGLVLVAAWMASEGAAVPSPNTEDTRFKGWIEAAADAAEANSLGFWATCGVPPVAPENAQASTSVAILPSDPFLNISR